MALAAGLVDPIHDAQAAFRAVMEAVSRPGRPVALAAALRPPRPLTPELAAIALALADADTPVWLDPPLSGAPDVAAFLRFHAGAPIASDPRSAVFALVSDAARCPPFAAFAQGEPDYPDRSTTLIMAVERLHDRGGLRLEGPGIRGSIELSAQPLPPDMAARLAANRAGFPCGVDVVLTAPGRVAGLPRSVRIRALAEA